MGVADIVTGGISQRGIDVKAGRYYSIASVLCIVCLSSAASADWKDFWKTPEQRALQDYEEGEYETLLRDAPDEGWTGLGQFQSENYPEASESFGARAAELREAGDIDAANRALYNQGVSDVMAGQFEQAIERFDQVLAEDPELNEALVNRNIAEELLKLQQQNESDQNGEQGESGEQGEQGESGDQQSEESQDGEQSQQSESGDGEQTGDPSADSQSPENAEQSEQESSSSNSQDSENEDDAAEQSEAERQQEADEAREALAAEAAEQGDQDQQGEGSERVDASSVTERPMSEEEQATEQLLRRIPDDPAGLLRRKLEQSHRNEYPEVRNAVEPW